MLKFKVIQNLESKTETLELLKNFKYTIKKGKINILINTNLQLIESTEYFITYNFAMAKIMEMTKEEQNQIALYFLTI